jgi:hypothetical protein
MERRRILLPLAGYSLLIVVLALTHTMWRDEVRAFSVATRASSWGQMLSWLPEEGHPVVWYALLRVGYAITGTQYVMPLIAALIGVATAYLILRYAPFSRPVRLFAVFGAFLAHELTVVTRNYGIGVLLLIGACTVWQKRQERPWLLAILLVLLANTSVHAAAAAALLAGLWLADLLKSTNRVTSLAGITVVVVAILFALSTSRPPSEMVYSFSLDTITPARVLRALLVDPGLGLRGTGGADLTAIGELPWGRFGIDEEVAGRIFTNIAVLAAAWGLRKNRLHLLALIATVLCFEFMFRVIYPGALRHMGLIAFIILSIGWVAVLSSRPDDREDAVQRISRGLLPLFAIQAIALPFVVVKHVSDPESQAASLARDIARDPRYRDAILMSEPDPLMETMPYYTSNPVYFPRQREYDFRTYFDRSQRQQEMTLSDLVAIADSVGCLERKPVLISIGYRPFHFTEQGRATGSYGVSFTWNAAERIEFARRTRALRWFPGATSDENYRTYELVLSC